MAQGPSRVKTRDERVDIGGGLKLRLWCDGSGTPPVVFDSGLGQGAEAWHQVLPAVATFTRACAYDRAGRGKSDPATPPHSNRQMARELAALLDSAGERGPFVVVGHSMGGTNVQLYLAQYPERVAGMVLIDASPEPPPFEAIPPQLMAEYEKNIAQWEWLDLETMLVGFKDLRESKRELGSRPLLVLVAGRAQRDPNLSEELIQSALRARTRAQAPLVQLSSNSSLITAHCCGHHIPHESPEFVVRAVRAVTQAAANGSRVPNTL